MRGRLGGVTLVEVVVALAVLGVLSAAVLGLLPGILRVNVRTRDDQGVTVAAKAYLEAVRAALDDPDVSTDPATGQVTTAGQRRFDAGTLPALPDRASLNGFACGVTQTPLVTTPPETGSVVTVRRVTLECTGEGRPAQVFTLDVARPP